MKITIREEGNYLIIELEGDLDSRSISEFRDEIGRVELSRTQFDLSEVESISKIYIREFVNAAKKLHQMKLGKPEIIAPSRNVIEALSATGTENFFRITEK